MLKKKIGLFGLKKLMKNNCAVSEVMGEVLLTAIAVLLVSSIGIFISTYDGAVDVPHTQVKGCMDEQNHTIYLEHSGGEFLKTEDFEAAVSINGTRYVYTSDNITENLKNSSIWGLGQKIEINMSSKWGINITDKDEIKVFLIDIPTKQVIQQLTVSSGEIESSDWVTPQGEVTDTSGGNATLLDVYKRNDNLYTTYHPLAIVDPSTYQEFVFATPSTFWGKDPGDPVSSVNLTIVYKVKDNSCKNIKLRIFDADASSGSNEIWEEYSLDETETEWSSDLSSFINSTYDVENFKVQVVAAEASPVKSLNVDYIALYVD